MQTLKRTLTFSRPPSAVFPYLRDPEKRRQWMADVETVRSEANGDEGPESVVTVDADGRRFELRVTVQECVADELLVLALESTLFEGTNAYRLTPTADGTRLGFEAETRLKGALGLVGPMAWGQVRRRYLDSLSALQSRVEATD